MQGPINDYNYNNLIGSTQRSASKRVFAQTMKGVYSAAILKRKIKSGNPVPLDEDPGFIYRRFYYNENGDVVKRILFDEGDDPSQRGNIQMKEESQYNEEGKILSSKFITIDNIIREEYEYDNEGHLLKYTLSNPKLSADKYESNELDENGRLIRITNYGLIGTPEYVSNYIYSEESDKNYAFKHVTKPDGALLITFYFTYEADGEQSYITGIYGFYLTPDEIVNLLEENKEDNGWELQSVFRSVWEYKDGKQTGFIRDEQIQKAHFDFGFTSTDERIVTDRSTMEYKTINGKDSLVKIIEWQTRFMEPWKEVKEYIYYDEADTQIFPPTEAEVDAAPEKEVTESKNKPSLKKKK